MVFRLWEWPATGRRMFICSCSLVGSVVKNPPANAGSPGSIPGVGRCPGGGNDNPVQYPCLENPADRGAWWATIHGVIEESDTTWQVNSRPRWAGSGSLPGLNKGTSVYSQPEEQGPLRQAVTDDYNKSSNKKASQRNSL